jgi:hypothetical protein
MRKLHIIIFLLVFLYLEEFLFLKKVNINLLLWREKLYYSFNGINYNKSNIKDGNKKKVYFVFFEFVIIIYKNNLK